jgi:hypothetical protein
LLLLGLLELLIGLGLENLELLPLLLKLLLLELLLLLEQLELLLLLLQLLHRLIGGEMKHFGRPRGRSCIRGGADARASMICGGS